MPGPLRGTLAAAARALGQRRAAELLGVVGKRSVVAYCELADSWRLYRAEFLGAMNASGIDAILCPPCSVPAVVHGATRDLLSGSFNYGAVYNLLAMPAGVVPVTRVREDEQRGRPRSPDRVDDTARLVDLGSARLPVGVQVVARHWREDVVLAVMSAIEAGLSRMPGHPGRPEI